MRLECTHRNSALEPRRSEVARLSGETKLDIASCCCKVTDCGMVPAILAAQQMAVALEDERLCTDGLRIDWRKKIAVPGPR